MLSVTIDTWEKSSLKVIMYKNVIKWLKCMTYKLD